jgi:hypothetical protein
MAKRNFSEGLDSLIPAGRKIGRPLKHVHEISKSSKEGLPESEIRATFILKEDTLEKLKAVAYWDRKQIREVHTEAIEAYLSAWEKIHGPVQPRPKK